MVLLRFVICVAVLALSSRALASDEPTSSGGRRADSHADTTPVESGDAQALFTAAESARAAGLFDACIEKDMASLTLVDNTATRVHLAGCAERAGKLLLAARQLQTVLEAAIQTRDPQIADLARRRVEQVVSKLAFLTLRTPTEDEVGNLEVSIDGEVVPPARLGKPIATDPGAHRVTATGSTSGLAGFFEEAVTLAPAEHATTVVALKPRDAAFLSVGQIGCLQLAKTQDEVLQCLPGREKPLVVRAALEIGGYADTLAVMVLNPAVRASVASPTHGYTFSASYQVDMISAASPDFVSTASPRGHDTRHAVAASGGYKPGSFGFDAAGAFSTESDYVSRTGGIGLRGDLFDKRMSPRIGWSTSIDTIGRGGTSFDVFSHKLTAHEASVSSTFVLSTKSTLAAGISYGIERGDPSKPYRLIPMFAAGVDLPANSGTDAVNAARLPIRPYEQLPTERDRLALSMRFAHRLKDTFTLRLEQRFYQDSWLLRASSTDARLLIDAGKRITFGPHGRFHVQSGANFYHRVYHAEISPEVAVPVFRTTDRELGPLVSITGGGTIWWRLSPAETSPRFLLYLNGDALYSRYRDSLYIDSRWAGYGTLGLEVELE